MKIITFSGDAEHGKDLSASILKDKLEESGHKVLIIHQADLLKFYCKTYFGWDGNKDDIGRSLLQRVGTDIVRAKSPNHWVDAVKRFLKLFEDEWNYILISDCRFRNEIEHLAKEDWDVTSVHITRLNYENHLTPEQRLHPSERALDGYNFDYYIESESGKEDLEKEISNFMKWMKENE